MKKLLTGTVLAAALMLAYAAPKSNFNIEIAFGQSNLKSQGDLGYTDPGKRDAAKMIEAIGDKSNPAPSESSENTESVSENANHLASLKAVKNGEVALHLENTEKIIVKVYTSLGKEVLDVSGNYLAGTNTVVLAGRVPAGSYVVSVQGKQFQVIKQATVK